MDVPESIANGGIERIRMQLTRPGYEAKKDTEISLNLSYVCMYVCVVSNFCLRLCIILCHHSDKDFVFHQLSAEELHISISRTVPLLFHWIDPIMIVLKEKISKYQIFSVGLSNLAYYTNDDKTR